MMRLLPILAAYHAQRAPGHVAGRINATSTVQQAVIPEDVCHLLDQFTRDLGRPLGELGGEGLAHLLALGGALHTARAWACRWGADVSGAAFRVPLGRDPQGARLWDLQVVAAMLINRNAEQVAEVLQMHGNTTRNMLAVVERLLGAQVLIVHDHGAGIRWWIETSYGEAIGLRRDGNPEGLIGEVLREGELLMGE